MSEAAAIVLLSKSDLDLEGDEPRVSHHVLAERLEVRPDAFKRTVERLSSEDEKFGELRVRVELSGTTKQRRTHAMLTEEQATKAIILSHSKKAIAMRNAIVAVFLAAKGASQASHLRALPSPLMQATEAMEASLVRRGVRPGLACAASLAVIEKHTGVPMEPARLLMPGEEKPLPSLTANPIGKEVGMTGVKVNLHLQSLGLQAKNARGEWEPTEEGKKLGGEMIAYDNNGHQGLQLRWPPSILEVFK